MDQPTPTNKKLRHTAEEIDRAVEMLLSSDPEFTRAICRKVLDMIEFSVNENGELVYAIKE